MAFGAAIFDGLTPDTSALALLAALPFLSLLAKIPLHLAETPATRSPSNWDGNDRRKPRPRRPTRCRRSAVLEPGQEKSRPAVQQSGF